MSGPDERFAIVPVPPVGPAPAESIVIGPMSEVMTYIRQSIPRIEEEQRLAQAKEDAEETERHQAEVRECAAQMLADGLTHLSNRLDAFETRKQEREEQARRDEEEAEAEAIEEYIASLPDPEDPQALSDDGELEIKPPPDTEKLDPEHRNEAVTGAMPNELDKGAPPEAGSVCANCTTSVQIP
jgi:hypothetical protein